MKDGLVASLSDLQVLQHRTDRSEQSILDRATRMADAVAARIREVMPKAQAGDEDAEAVYQHLILEQGRLQMIISRAREAIGS